MAKPTSIKHLTPYKSPDESPGYLLWRVSTRWRSVLEHELQKFSLTHPQFVVLATLSWLTHDGAIVSQIEVGRLAGLDPNTTSQIIRGLETKKLIKRLALRDERSKNPVLTEQGTEILAGALPAVEQRDSEFFATLTSSELMQVKQLLQKLM